MQIQEPKKTQILPSSIATRRKKLVARLAELKAKRVTRQAAGALARKDRQARLSKRTRRS